MKQLRNVSTISTSLASSSLKSSFSSFKAQSIDSSRSKGSLSIVASPYLASSFSIFCNFSAYLSLNLSLYSFLASFCSCVSSQLYIRNLILLMSSVVNFSPKISTMFFSYARGSSLLPSFLPAFIGLNRFHARKIISDSRVYPISFSSSSSL